MQSDARSGTAVCGSTLENTRVNLATWHYSGLPSESDAGLAPPRRQQQCLLLTGEAQRLIRSISPGARLVRACVPHSRMPNTLETSFMHEESKRTQARDSICSSTPCLAPEASPHSLPRHMKTPSHSPERAEVTQETPHFTLDQDCPLSSPQIKN